jgi:hypothetical protein
MAESTILETNENGALQIPAGVLKAGPHVRFRVEHEGDAVHLIRDLKQPDVLPNRVLAFREWLAGLPKRSGPPIPAEALRRENLYDS